MCRVLFTIDLSHLIGGLVLGPCCYKGTTREIPRHLCPLFTFFVRKDHSKSYRGCCTYYKQTKIIVCKPEKNPLVSPLGLFTSPSAYFTFVPSCKFPNNSMYMSYAVARSLSMVSRSVTARPDCFSFTNLSFAVCGIMEVKTLLCQYKTETLPVTANKFKETSNQ